MKALIFSDSHGHSEGMRRAISIHRDAEVCFFLGDGLRDVEEMMLAFPHVMFLSVAGNCDWFSGDAPKEGMFTLVDKKVFYTHGHLYGVKGGVGQAVLEARRREADVLLFGHTHIPFERCETSFEKPLWVFNPGSIGRMSEGALHYGVMEVRENGILLSHGKVLL